MCGINGILRLDPGKAPVDPAELRRTRDRMASRGPDGVGEWVSPDGSMGLGHRRLAIIDLTDAGLQPMERSAGRYRIVFNGEIYNYAELRESLARDGETFVSTSDTEVIVALYARHGVAMLPMLRGMYAMAIWDDREKRLLLARDPYGIKPLYVAERGGYLRFASQVKALEAGGALPSDPDPAGIVGFLLWGSVPGPLTIRRSIRAVPPGNHVVVEDGKVGSPVRDHVLRLAPREGGPPVEEALRDSVRAHLVADVPVGVFLSAGIDSSLIATLASREHPEPLTSLTVTFGEFEGTERDEGPLARTIADRLGLRHVERRVSVGEIVELWPRCLDAMDQPSVDGLNSYLVSKVAHDEGLKVVLSGLGGDELFGSYSSFRQVPLWARRARALALVPGLEALWPRASRIVGRGIPKLPGLLRYATTIGGAYFLRRGLFLPEELEGVLGAELAREGLTAYEPMEDVGRALRERGECPPDSGWTAVHVLESSLYMGNQLLRDSDWASMAHSLELRVPLVDAKLQAEIAARGFEPARTRGKVSILRSIAPGLGADVFDRPKSGFGVPLANWIEGLGTSRLTPGTSSRGIALNVLESFGVRL